MNKAKNSAELIVLALEAVGWGAAQASRIRLLRLRACAPLVPARAFSNTSSKRLASLCAARALPIRPAPRSSTLASSMPAVLSGPRRLSRSSMPCRILPPSARAISRPGDSPK